MITIIILGFLFGAILQYARLNKYNVISGMATLDDLTVAKAIATAIGVGAILLNIEIAMGLASYHVKPFIFGGVALGGLIFGIGMAILGYCPGTLAVSLGEGSLDALLGIIGGLLGGLFYTILLPVIQPVLGPDLGSISLNSLMGGFSSAFFFLVVIIGVVFVGVAVWLNKLEKKKEWKWLYAGIALAVLNTFVFSVYGANRPIGASTSYPYLADLLSGLTGNDYYGKIQGAGSWELVFLIGAFLSGIVVSVLRKDFKFAIIHSNWGKYKGAVVSKRVFWAFTGGFILIFGARMAGGCTSGHIISGGMQMAVSSFVFAIFVFIGLLATGYLFYKRSK